VSSWRTLRDELRRLERLSPCPLELYPSLDSPHPPSRPIDIELAASATAVAADLHARFGDVVRLRVGLLNYPEDRAQPAGKSRKRSRRSQPYLTASGRPLAERYGLHLGLEDPANPPVIRSRYTAEVPVKVTNTSKVDRHLQTNGHLRTYVVDAEGTMVGSGYGLHHMALVVFSIRPDDSVSVPALIGTASMNVDLGYSIPPGNWDFIVELILGGDLWAPVTEEVTVWSNAIPFEIRPED
jgi:hypothetical protein